MVVQDLGSFKERFASVEGLGRDQIASEMARGLAEAGHDVSKVRARIYLDEVLRVIQTALEAGKHVELRGFGSFYPHRRGVRRIFSPLVKKAVRVDARWIVRFDTSKILKKRLMETLEG